MNDPFNPTTFGDCCTDVETDELSFGVEFDPHLWIELRGTPTDVHGKQLDFVYTGPVTLRFSPHTNSVQSVAGTVEWPNGNSEALEHDDRDAYTRTPIAGSLGDRFTLRLWPRTGTHGLPPAIMHFKLVKSCETGTGIS